MITIHERHMELIDAVNNAETQRDHDTKYAYLRGWRNGMEVAGRRVDLIEADLEQDARGHDRPMCCGVFLDWTPKA